MHWNASLLLCGLGLALSTSAQLSPAYTLARPIDGGDLYLLRLDLDNGTETEIANFPAAQLEDYDPGATTFDHANSRFITLATTGEDNTALVGIGAATGYIEFSYESSNYELFSVEHSNGNVYSLARPMGGGDLVLLSTDVATGMENVIATYAPSELEDYDPGSTTFDHDNGRMMVLGAAQDGPTQVLGLDVADGTIAFTFSPTEYELFSVEYHNGDLYSLARPVDGGNLVLYQISVATGEAFVLYTYSASELDDYDPGATCFDHANGAFMAIASDQDEAPFAVAISSGWGTVEASLASDDYEYFSIECDTPTSVHVDAVEAPETLLHVYPNPAVDRLTWEGHGTWTHIEILDRQGRIVLATTPPHNFIDVSHLESGMYSLMLHGEDSPSIVTFIKE